MTRNLIRSNIEAGQFDVLDKFFKSAATGKADLKDLQAGALGIQRKDLRSISDTQRADLISMQTAGFGERGLIDESGKLTAAAKANTDVAANDINKILEQDDKFKSLGINVQQTAENFRELKISLKF